MYYREYADQELEAGSLPNRSHAFNLAVRGTALGADLAGDPEDPPLQSQAQWVGPALIGNTVGKSKGTPLLLLLRRSHVPRPTPP